MRLESTSGVQDTAAKYPIPAGGEFLALLVSASRFGETKSACFAAAFIDLIMLK